MVRSALASSTAPGCKWTCNDVPRMASCATRYVPAGTVTLPSAQESKQDCIASVSSCLPSPRAPQCNTLQPRGSPFAAAEPGSVATNPADSANMEERAQAWSANHIPVHQVKTYMYSCSACRHGHCQAPVHSGFGTCSSPRPIRRIAGDRSSRLEDTCCTF